MTSPQHIFLKYLSKKGMAATEQRRVVLEIFLKSKGHFSYKELYIQVREADSSISSVTVYRTVKLLAKCGIAGSIDFGDGITRYECRYNRPHHDHLVCTKCGKKIGVVDDSIENLQELLAEKHGFSIKRHKMILFGICSDCRDS
ncbi:Fur family transcriptional regulator [Maridesulfovibrio ferrireducens]|uniref:Fur family transcriptional regulator n=1 Tax=Maridesulfovibrio ferrireducens TaxID=246191 RepID=UPI001A1F76FC|nr:Fur family transcriptional regulator [Maridesulfovibrio ferrireducens]MBI9112769.1 transcriptional repressor [Maridesulfovibrio ferrireducens]